MKVSQLSLLKEVGDVEAPDVEILEIYIDGFRNVVDTRIVFSNQITTLLSNNNYGKSNTFSAIKFALEIISANKPQQLLSIRTGINSSNNKHANRKPFAFEIVLKTTFEGEDVNLCYNYVISWGVGVIAENLTLKKAGGGREKRLLSRDEKSVQYCSSQSGRCNTNLPCSKTALALTILSYMPSYHFSALVSAISSCSFGMYSRLDVGGDFFPLSYEDVENLEVPVEYVQETLFLLNENYKDEFARIKSAFLTLFEQYTDMRVVQYTLNPNDFEEIDNEDFDEEDYENNSSDMFPEIEYRLFFIDKNHLAPDGIEELSNGTFRVLCMLVNAVVSNINKLPLLGFEEVETGIHPALMCEFLQAVLDLAGNTKFLITTHSTSIVQFLRPESIYVGKASKNGLAKFQVIPPSGLQLLKQEAKAYGVSEGEVIFKYLSSGDEGTGELAQLLN